MTIFAGFGVQPINFSILTRGQDPGIYYTPSYTINAGGGAFFSAGLTLSGSNYTGNPRAINAGMLPGHTFGVMANGGYIGDFSFGMSFSPTDISKRQGFINGSVGVGVGVGIFGGVQYQNTFGYIPIWHWKK